MKRFNDSKITLLLVVLVLWPALSRARSKKDYKKPLTLRYFLLATSPIICYNTYQNEVLVHPSASLRIGFEFWLLDIVSDFVFRFSDLSIIRRTKNAIWKCV